MLLDTEDMREIEGAEKGYAGQQKDTVRLFMTIQGKMDKIKVGDIIKSISQKRAFPNGR